MLTSEFSAAAPGTLHPIEDGWAYLPHPLPPRLDASWELHSLDEKARGALGEFMGQARAVDNDLLILNPLAVREAVESNKIENTITRARDVLLQGAGERMSDAASASDVVEVLQYRHTLDVGAFEIARGRPLSVHLVRTLHEELLRGTRGANKSPGVFRTEPVLIGKEHDTYVTARFVPAPWEQVPALMDDLLSFAEQPARYSPLISAALLHYQIETIHPFLDGNGRLGRLLIPLYLMSKAVVDRPIVYLSPYFERHRDEYIHRLKRVSTEGAWSEWVAFFLRAVETQAVDSLRRVRTVAAIEDSYRTRARAAAKTKATLPAVDVVMEKVVVSASEVAEYANVSLNTAKAAIANLVELGVLTVVPRSWPVRWLAPELIERVYES